MSGKKLLLPAFLTLMLFVAAGCSPASTDDTQANVTGTDSDTEADAMLADSDEMMMESPAPLSAEEAAKYTSDLPLTDRIKMAEELAKMMPKDGMDQMRAIFPDLEVTEDIADSDDRNLMGMGAEQWAYTKEGDMTVVICVGANSPIAVFQGDSPSDAELKETSEMMEKMMEAMMEEGKITDADAVEEIPEGGLLLAEYVEGHYAKQKATETIGNEPVALFFHAEWCHVCRGLEESLKNELEAFPVGTRIIELDFDTETELKKQFGVNVQSTVVVLDKNGEISETLAAPSNKELADAIQKTLT